jgi:hypothetical protein
MIVGFFRKEFRGLVRNAHTHAPGLFLAAAQRMAGVTSRGGTSIKSKERVYVDPPAQGLDPLERRRRRAILNFPPICLDWDSSNVRCMQASDFRASVG